MGNKIVARACAIVAADKTMISLAEFWPAFGRPDLVGAEIHVTAPVLLEIRNVAERVFARRRGEVSPERKPPLREFVLQRVDHRKRPVWPAHAWTLHPTKGWRRSVLDTHHETKIARENWKLPFFDRWPK